MSSLLQITDLAQLSWLEIDLTLVAHGPPRRAHPLAVLEALFKGVFEAARLDARAVKQIWHWPGTPVDAMRWQADTRIAITLQLFGLPPEQIPAWMQQLHARFAPDCRQNFTLADIGPWRIVQARTGLDDKATLSLDFITPVPLPHTPGRPNTTLDEVGFVRLCQTRLRKLFGREGALPPPPAFETTAWRYWRTEHRSRSQAGHPMFLNGCVGPLHLSGPQLPDWRPWLALFAAVGLGERLSFSQGRFLFADAPPETGEQAPAPLQLRRPFVLDASLRGARLGLNNANLTVNHEDLSSGLQLPLMRLASVELHSPCQLTTPLLEACASEGIPVVLASPGQTPLVMTGQQAEAQRNRTLAAHHASWSALDDAQRARIAARLIDAKLAGCAWLVRQRYQVGDHRLIAQFDRARTAMAQTERLSVVRGWEGWAARHYHHWLKQHMEALGVFQRRRTHGQNQDPINLLLNYSYALLRHRLSIMIRLAGLDPYLGILHEANGRHEALVSDFMEPWRSHVDRLVLRWINLKVVQATSFVDDDGLLRLLPKARSRIVQDFTRMLEEPPRQGNLKLETLIRQVIQTYGAAARKSALAAWEFLPASASQDEPGSDQGMPVPSLLTDETGAEES